MSLYDLTHRSLPLLGLVLFLEEDHYVAPDFIYVLHLMQQTAHSTCSKCNIFSLGTYLKAYNYYSDNKKVCFMEISTLIERTLLNHSLLFFNENQKHFLMILFN